MKDGGVAEVLSSWRTQSGRERSAPRGTLPPDFVSLNRDAVKAGTVTPKELSQYRAQGGGAKTQRPAPTQQRGGASQRPAIPDVTFGVPTWPSSPLSDLLSHQYARRRQDEQRSRNQTSNQPQQHRVPPALDTFRDQEKKTRKARSAFSEQQLSRLERSFQKQKYLSVQDRMDLSTRLQMSDGQVKTWYQNRRTKWKRQSAAGLELLAEAGRMFLPAHFLYPPAPPTPELYLYRGHTHHHTAPPLLHHILAHTEPHAR
ncbi:hypothetical protein SMAX5B_015247 [Scophthalmus maximus]|uniref:Homeobox domain-containing protein n=1 Tax=Scophthalmus maximus TaxID=52904 RepID=A0A2U9BU89_SCOMX|nr:hypothetical protein SMAX5B_015247 [Scophthalmus maximus]